MLSAELDFSRESSKLRIPMAERVILRRGDTIRETLRRQGTEEVEKRWEGIVDSVGTNSEGRDYLHIYYPVDQGDAPFMAHIDLLQGEKQGEKAVISSEFTTEGGLLHHKIEKVEASKGTK